MAIIKGDKVTEKYGIYESQKTIFSKFKTYKDRNNELKYRARETKSNKLTRDIYNVKGQIIFRFRVSSYYKRKNTLVRDSVSDEEVIVERGLLNSNLNDIVENAKLQATYSHFRKKGDSELINDTKRLKNQIMKFELLDYIINYNKGYSSKNGISYLKFEKDKKTRDIETYVYDENTKNYNLYSITEHKSIKEREEQMNNIKIKQEKIYSKIY